MSEQRNPKYIEALKRGKVDYSVVPWPAVTGMVQAMEEGAGKYGRLNFRQDRIEARTYVAAILRHLFGDPSTGSVGWVNGEDIDEESGLHHLHKVMACCLLVLDAQDHDMLIDNRLETESKTPPSAQEDPKAERMMSDSERDDMIDAYAQAARANFVIGDGRLGEIKTAQVEDDGYVTLYATGHCPFPGEREGWYVRFTDESPGVDEWFETVTGPFADEDAARAYAIENPDKIAGLRSIFNVT